MGWLTTRWEATHNGHNITVTRNEVLRGFNLEWDGREIARRSWSFIGLGELHGSAEYDGGHHDIHASLEWSGGINDGVCKITVDGNPLDVKHVR
jgi:hypothetical protein